VTTPLSPSGRSPDTLPAWPYPRWIAHRGAGLLAPENTLAAFRLGAAHGYRMFECDVKLSADGVPFLLHDSTLGRTTSGQGTAGDHSWHDLSQLDAGRWHSRQHAGETLPTLAAIASACFANGWLLNIEIKPTPGLEAHTGHVVALAARQLWGTSPPVRPVRTPPLLTSFSPDALAAAQASAPELPRGLLLDSLWEGWLDTALRLACVAVVCRHTLWTAEVVAAAHGAGLRALSYTVNDGDAAQGLLALGTDGLITDRVDLFAPDHHTLLA
jgi:glycerophosphoryl diester phosphodiesterase